MNMSKLINDKKIENGLTTIALPFDQPIETIMKEVVKVAIHTFSHYKKAEKGFMELVSNLRSPDEDSKRIGVFYIPEFLSMTEVHDVYAVPVSFSNWRRGEAAINTFTVGSPFVGFGTYYPQDILNAIATGAAINKYAGVTNNPQTSEWLGYNKIRLYNYPADSLVFFVAKCDHEESGETIPASQEEAFKDLFELVLQKTLYNHLKNVNNHGSAFKEYQYKIDEWASADEQLKNMRKEWRDTAHLDDIEDTVQFF